MRALRPLLAVVATCLVCVPPATAAERVTLSSADAERRVCHARPAAGAPGVATHRWRASGEGIATIGLDGTRFSDWDLAVFGVDGSRLGASTSFGATERALARVAPGQEVLIQACRRFGSESSVPLTIDFDAVPRSSGGQAAMIEVPVETEGDLRRLEATGVDVTHDAEVGGEAKVVVYSAAERARVERAGFETTVIEADLAAVDRADRRAEARAAPGSARVLPSGRTTYRQPQDYTDEMKALAEAPENAGLVREVTLPLASLENRPIEGIEIATGVTRTDDGRPVYLQMGAHHAREWPSAEFPMEFARDLVAKYNAGDGRVRSLLARVRVIVVPVVNVDGFAVSRGAGQPTPLDDDSSATLGLALSDQSAYKRKNCRPTVAAQAAQPCATRTGSGVDLNRNYGAYWGGTGSSSTVSEQSYRGPAPYSEPESEAVHQLTAKLQVVTFITNHTFTEDGKFLRQPGFDDVITVAPDEPRMKALGDAMGQATGWTSELGYETLGDITGATEDWNYFAQGTFGYTPEAKGTNFHANYATAVVGQYPGVYEAFLRAGEQAADPVDHSIITGTAPPGRTLRLRKQFVTATSQSAVNVSDKLETTMTVPAGGTYTWHVNPSKRPLFANSSERWTMTCEDGAGTVLGTANVDVGRNQTAFWNFACTPGDTGSSSPQSPQTTVPTAAGAGAAAGPSGARSPSVAPSACSAASATLTRFGIGALRLGTLQAGVRGTLARGRRTRGAVDRFCLAGGGAVRVGYPSAALRRALSRRERARVNGRAVLLLSSSPRSRLRAVAVGASTRALARRIGTVKPIRIGAASWYVARGSAARHVFRVTGGKVREIGLADTRLTASRPSARRLFASFR